MSEIHIEFWELLHSRRYYLLCSFLFFITSISFSQPSSKIDSFYTHGDVKVTIDQPLRIKHKTNIIFFALPNGNSTEQTMGKKMQPGDDWHFDIQHIRAQTAFLRKRVPSEDFVVIYLENKYKSWPAWKQKNADYKTLIPHLVDSLAAMIRGKHKSLLLSGHSGGGSFIFGYLAGVEKIPSKITSISFLDSNYGYDSSYYQKLREWLKENKQAHLTVFAYNDSIALLNGKPFVSATGGTWYRSHLMLTHFSKDVSFNQTKTDSLVIFKSAGEKIQFFFKQNFDRGIYHTQQVELNGFIHAVLAGTKNDSKGYSYYGQRAYQDFIE